MNNRYKKPSIIGLIVLFVALILLLFFMFNTTGEEAENLLDDLDIYDNPKGKVQDYMLVSTLQNEIDGKFQAVEEEILAMHESVDSIGDLAVPDNLNYFSTGNPKYDAVNLEIYAIALRAVQDPKITSMPEEFRDPLTLMAQSLTENQDVTNPSKVFVPAIPTHFMDDADINVETLRTFNVVRGTKLTKTRKYKNIPYTFIQRVGKNTKHQGPLQMSDGYGTGLPESKRSLENIIYTSDWDNLSRDSGAMSIYKNSTSAASRKRYVSGSNPKIGDRHNWNDAANVSWQVWNYEYSQIVDDRYKKIKSSGALLAYLGMNHNIGGSVSTERNMNRSRGICSTCTYTDVWNYIDAFNDPRVQEVISKYAKEQFEQYKQSGSISHIDPSTGGNMLKAAAPDIAIFKKVNYNTDSIGHPIRVNYWYYVLREFYYNGGTPTGSANAEPTPEPASEVAE